MFSQLFINVVLGILYLTFFSVLLLHRKSKIQKVTNIIYVSSIIFFIHLRELQGFIIIFKLQISVLILFLFVYSFQVLQFFKFNLKKVLFFLLVFFLICIYYVFFLVTLPGDFEELYSYLKIVFVIISSLFLPTHFYFIIKENHWQKRISFIVKLLLVLSLNMEVFFILSQTTVVSYLTIAALFYSAVLSFFLWNNFLQSFSFMEFQNRSLLFFTSIIPDFKVDENFFSKLCSILDKVKMMLPANSCFYLNITLFPSMKLSYNCSSDGFVLSDTTQQAEKNYYKIYKKTDTHELEIYFFQSYKTTARFLRHFLNQLSLHLLSHSAYIKIINYNKELNTKVAVATNSLREKNIELEIEKEKQAKWFRAVSHDLKTPLTHILGRLEFMIDSSANKSTKEVASLMGLQKSSRSMELLIENLLFKSRIDRGGLAVNTSSFFIFEIIDIVMEDFKDFFQAKNQSINFVSKHKKSELKPVLADFHLLERIFINIFSNANKYAPENSSINIEILYNKNYCTIRFINECKTYKRKEISKLFLEFNSSYTKKGSSGLGLSVCQNLAEQMNGKFSAIPMKNFICFQLKLKIEIT